MSHENFHRLAVEGARAEHTRWERSSFSYGHRGPFKNCPHSDCVLVRGSIGRENASENAAGIGCGSIYMLSWLMFVAIKLGGHTLAAWSWWWFPFAPFVPLMGVLVQKLGL